MFEGHRTEFIPLNRDALVGGFFDDVYCHVIGFRTQTPVEIREGIPLSYRVRILPNPHANNTYEYHVAIDPAQYGHIDFAEAPHPRARPQRRRG